MTRIRPLINRMITALVLVALTGSLAFAQPTQAADQSLVFEALKLLETHYVDPVDPVKVLNAALAALRTQLSSAGIAVDLADIPPGVTDGEARRLFADRFTTAATISVGSVTRTQLAYAAIRGMTESFNDSHTGLLTPQQNAERRLRQRGQPGFSGVGIILLPKDGKFFVSTVIPGGPAEAAGVQDFDRIVRINEVSTGGMIVDQISGMIRGSTGTPVTLTLQRAGIIDPFVLTIVRGPIVVPSVFKAELLEGAIGYIKLFQFVERTGRDVRTSITRLLAQGMRVMVLDLRGNSGGFLSELNSVLNTLLPVGVPVYTEMRQGGQVRIVRTTGSSVLPASVPLVVLIDEGSASAAELLAAAIKESKRGQLIGERTSGAVEASVLFDLSDGSAVSITTFRLATGRGIRLEGAGVEPDIQAALTVADLEIGLDRPLGAALSVARQVIAQQVR